MINSFLNYTGSKYKLLPQLLPHFDYSKNTFIDMFAGGGSVFANVVDKYEKIIANDKVSDLIKIYELIFDDQFVTAVKSVCPNKGDKDGYLQLRKSYNDYPSPDKLMALMLCCHNNIARFNLSGKFNATYGDRSFNLATEIKIDNWVNCLKDKISKISFHSLDFGCYLVLPKNDKFFYFDPPYNSKINNGAGYNNLCHNNNHD